MSTSPFFSTPVRSLAGVGPILSTKLQQLGIETLQDLLFHLPLRYEDRSRIYSIKELSMEMRATIQGEITYSQVVTQKRRMLICQLQDKTGSILLRFFNFNSAMQKSFSPGRMITAYGEVKKGRSHMEMLHPEYRLHALESNNEQTVAGREQNATLTPIYPTTQGINQAILRKIMQKALSLLQKYPIEELLPAELNPTALSISEALILLHRPPSDSCSVELEQGKHPAQHRLIFEELLAHNLSLLQLRTTIQVHPAPRLKIEATLQQRMLNSLPFILTSAQQRVIEEIAADLRHTKPMMRLVQGDVGSGKTLVAAFSALAAISCGKQVALMAPTELLAEQHVTNFQNWFEPLGISVGQLMGKQKKSVRREQLCAIQNGTFSLVIGTHALFQEQVIFNNLALVIIDEQHRFGVHQRLSLLQKGNNGSEYPHQLIMTATPIPRTLEMTAYSYLDVSVIDALPPGRKPIKTITISDSRRDEVIERIQTSCCVEQRQVYWVCTLIEESEILEAQAAEVVVEELKQLLPSLKIGLLHGRMKSSEKHEVMKLFKQGDLQLLVATTVIEVGVDVPNASLMVIDNPERLGLAQLHQLRGRIGRGNQESFCVLLYKTPLSVTAYKRLQVLKESSDGFFIAEKDLEIRGTGELLGTRQSGHIEFKITDLIRDQALIPKVQNAAQQLLQHHPDPIEKLIERWLPRRTQYGYA